MASNPSCAAWVAKCAKDSSVSLEVHTQVLTPSFRCIALAS
ncbi:hypothetical protein ACT3UQ_17120 [Glutamicibacter sp. AOP12-B1-11]